MRIVGHRGARGLAPENTISSIEAALACRVDEIEFDLRVTGDGVVVLNHDQHLHGDGGQRLLISDHTHRQLKAAKKDLATFEEALSAINKRAPALIEVKPGEAVEPIVKIIKKHLAKGWRSSDFLLCSFSHGVLRQLHQQLPDIQKVVNERWSGVRAARRAKELGARRLSMNRQVLWFGYIAAMRRRGYQLYAYPLNNPAKAAAWAKYGLAGVITDYPDRY